MQKSNSTNSMTSFVFDASQISRSNSFKLLAQVKSPSSSKVEPHIARMWIDRVSSFLSLTDQMKALVKQIKSTQSALLLKNEQTKQSSTKEKKILLKQMLSTSKQISSLKAELEAKKIERSELAALMRNAPSAKVGSITEQSEEESPLKQSKEPSEVDIDCSLLDLNPSSDDEHVLTY